MITMHTVYIHSSRGFVNADQIESILYSEPNKIGVKIGQIEDESSMYTIYCGKAVNREIAVIKILSLINEAKLESSKNQKAVILDFIEDIDNHKAYVINRSRLKSRNV